MIHAQSNWNTVTLSEIAEVITGSTPSKKKSEYYGKGIPFVTPVELGQSIPVVTSKTTITAAGAAEVRIVPKETIMVCCIGSLGKVGIAGTELATNQQINSLVVDRSIADPRYVFHYCRTLTPVMQQIAPATTVAIVNKTRFSQLSIPLPPLSEQKRIAHILDKADAIRRKRQDAVEEHESLLSSAFSHCVGSRAQGYEDWTSITLGDIADFVGGSSLPEGQPFVGQTEGILLVKVAEMNLPGNEIRLITAREWVPSASKRYAFCPQNAIVIPKRGGAIGTNKKRLLDRDGLLDPNLMGIVPRNEQYSAWLFQWFQHFDLLRLVSGSAVPQLNKKDLAPIVLREPPQTQLMLFAEATDAIRSSQETSALAATEAENLFNSLVQRAFKGEL